MATPFQGWPAGAYEVLLELQGEPSAETRQRVRRQREQLVRRPMIDLFNDLADADSWYEDFAVWHYASMASMWQTQSGIVRVAGNVEITFGFNLDGLQVTAAWWYARGEEIGRYRAAVAADGTGRVLAGLVSALLATGHEIGGDIMQRVPRGYPADHPRAALLRHRTLLASCALETEELRDAGPVYRACEQLRPLLGWLAGHTAAAA